VPQGRTILPGSLRGGTGDVHRKEGGKKARPKESVARFETIEWQKPGGRRRNQRKEIGPVIVGGPKVKVVRGKEGDCGDRP